LEVFVTEFDSEAKSLVYSTYFGGSKRDVGDSIQVDSSGAYIVAGTTVSPDYPVTPGAFDTTYNGGDEYYGDFFVTKLNQTPAPNTAPMILNFETSPAKEGSPLNFTVNACDAEGDPLTYSFDFESDGTIDVTSPDKDVYHTWGDDYEGTATVSVSDGNLSTTATSSYTIENVPPLVAVIPPPIGDEGDTFPFLVRVTDPGSDDITIEWSASCTGLSSSTVYPNNPSSFPDPYPSPEFNPRDITEGQNVTCGDDGVLSWGVRVTDDDGGTTEKDGTFTVKNLPPTLSVQPPSLTQIDEGVLMTLMATATDPGSDDIVFMWYGECSGWSSPVSYPNDPSAFPDPDPSPEIDPRNVTDTQNVVCGDDGLYSWRLVVEDDDGGSVSAHGDISTSNVAPSAVIGGEMTIHEGEMVRLIATAADQGSDDLTFSWSWGEGFSESRTYFNDGLGPDSPRSPNGTFPFTAVDETAHVYGDNGIYTITLTVIDDDGDSTVLRTELTVLNLPPEIMLLAIPTSVNENEEFTLVAEATDQGSDDIEFSWTFEVGPSMSTMFYNDGVGPDPPMSPWGTFPFTAEDPATYTYGDNGHYNVTIIAADDDGGISTMTFTIDVKNLAPSVDIGGPYWGVENSPIDFTAIASDPGSDDLTFIWDWGDGTTDDAVFYNNGLGPDPPKSPWGEYPFNVNHAISHIWGDNGDFTVTLTVMDDDGGTTVQETVLSIENVAPTIESIRYYLNASFTFRIAGEKWHNVEIFLYEEGTEIGYADITRYPGSPNEQMVTLADISIDFSKTYSAVAYYTPEDDPVNGQIWGATPAWVILDYEDGEERIHHTFNVRHEDTWTWVIDDFSAYFLGHNITFMATASDPGSDDLTFSWDWGDGNTTENTYFNDGVGPDPYPSPEVNPITVTDTVKHAHASAGPYTVTLTVTDDDGGITSYSLNLAL
jgi:PKD repeat protein